MSDISMLSKADALKQIAKLEKQLARRKHKEANVVDSNKPKAGSEKKGDRYLVKVRDNSSIVLLSKYEPEQMSDLHLLNVNQ
jgi:hypothetical protein